MERRRENEEEKLQSTKRVRLRESPNKYRTETRQFSARYTPVQLFKVSLFVLLVQVYCVNCEQVAIVEMFDCQCGAKIEATVLPISDGGKPTPAVGL